MRGAENFDKISVCSDQRFSFHFCGTQKCSRILLFSSLFPMLSSCSLVSGSVDQSVLLLVLKQALEPVTRMEPVFTKLVLIWVFFMHLRMKQDQPLLPALALCLESTKPELIHSDYIITAPTPTPTHAPPALLLFAGFIFLVSSSRFLTTCHMHCAASGCTSLRFVCKITATRVATRAT